MVSPTQRDDEFIADPASESAALGKAQVMSVRGLPAADQAGALGDSPDVVPVADPARLWQGQQTFVDRPGPAPSILPFDLPAILYLQAFRGPLVSPGCVRSTHCKGG